eukprot:144106-Pyramimonas_sp.AAC.1
MAQRPVRAVSGAGCSARACVRSYSLRPPIEACSDVDDSGRGRLKSLSCYAWGWGGWPSS